MLAKFLASQLRRPSGFFGRNVLLHLLNRANLPLNTLTLECLSLNPDDRVLEIGFGGGDLMGKIAAVTVEGRVTGVDFSRDVVDVCSKRFARLIDTGKVDLYCSDAAELPFEPSTFTKVCTVNTIYFWPDPAGTLSQIHRVLKAGGLVVLCFAPKSEMEGRVVMRHGFTLYDPDDVRELLITAGFMDIEIQLRDHRNGKCAAAIGRKL
jgi:arsenite methyltransferase